MTSLERRINARLQQFKGMKNSPAVQSMMSAVVSEELHRAEELGDVQSAGALEVRVADIYDDTVRIEVRERQPPQIELKVEITRPPRGPSTPPDLDWEAKGRFTEEELTWVWRLLQDGARGHHCVDNFRAAKLWKRTHRVRFKRLSAQGCCGSTEWVAKKWNPAKARDDLYLLGFNHGH